VVQIHSNRIADCVSRCDATAGCTDITMSGTTCYMKGKAGPASTCSDCSAARLVGSANSSSSSVTSTSVSVASLSTSSQSMTAAPSTTSISTTDNGTEYIRYSTVGGYFLQDLNATNASTFDYVSRIDRLRDPSPAKLFTDRNKFRPHQSDVLDRLWCWHKPHPMAAFQPCPVRIEPTSSF